MSNTNVGSFKDWLLEQSHFNRIPLILFLLSAVWFRIAVLGTALGKILNRVMAAFKYYHISFLFELLGRVCLGFSSISGHLYITFSPYFLSPDFLLIRGIGSRVDAAPQCSCAPCVIILSNLILDF